uniref:snRNA-activating protein complex subunit 4 n=1 Tax=Rhabditophanes sp. KR3021 TaxID=114890 RepID=A0AC35TPI4_9BILA
MEDEDDFFSSLMGAETNVPQLEDHHDSNHYVPDNYEYTYHHPPQPLHLPIDPPPQPIPPPDITHSLQELTKLLMINKAYQKTLDDMLLQIEIQMKGNVKKQSLLKQKLQAAAACGTYDLTVPMFRDFAIFEAPFFRDENGAIPRRGVESFVFDDLNPFKGSSNFDWEGECELEWEDNELELLREGVRDSMIKAKSKTAANHRETLIFQLKNADHNVSGQEMEDLARRIQDLDRKIDYYKKMKNAELFDKANFEEVDWMKIASGTQFLNGWRSKEECKAMWMNYLTPSINKSEWTKEEVKKLMGVASKDWTNWATVRAEMGTGRSEFMYFEKFRQEKTKFNEKTPFSRDEDRWLKQLVKMYSFDGVIFWDKVAAVIGSRGRTVVRTRYERALCSSLVKGRWTQAEDMALISAVKQLGATDWKQISTFVKGRSDTGCRERYINVLEANVKIEPWSMQEDEIIIKGIELFGKSEFRKIKTLLPGRTRDAVKARVRRYMRNKLRTKMEPNEMHLKEKKWKRGFVVDEKKLDQKTQTKMIFERYAEIFLNGITPEGKYRQGLAPVTRVKKDECGKASICGTPMLVHQNGRWTNTKYTVNNWPELQDNVFLKELPPDLRQRGITEIRQIIQKYESIAADGESQTEMKERVEAFCKKVDEVLDISENDKQVISGGLRLSIPDEYIALPAKLINTAEAVLSTEQLQKVLLNMTVDEGKIFYMKLVCEMFNKQQLKHNQKDFNKVVDVVDLATMLTDYLQQRLISTVQQIVSGDGTLNYIQSLKLRGKDFLVPPSPRTYLIVEKMGLYEGAFMKEIAKYYTTLPPEVVEAVGLGEEETQFAAFHVTKHVKQCEDYKKLKLRLFSLLFFPLMIARVDEEESILERRRKLRLARLETNRLHLELCESQEKFKLSKTEPYVSWFRYEKTLRGYARLELVPEKGLPTELSDNAASEVVETMAGPEDDDDTFDGIFETVIQNAKVTNLEELMENGFFDNEDIHPDALVNIENGGDGCLSDSEEHPEQSVPAKKKMGRPKKNVASLSRPGNNVFKSTRLEMTGGNSETNPSPTEEVILEANQQQDPAPALVESSLPQDSVEENPEPIKKPRSSKRTSANPKPPAKRQKTGQ